MRLVAFLSICEFTATFYFCLTTIIPILMHVIYRYIEPEIAAAIAEGRLDPITKKPLSPTIMVSSVI